MTQSPGIVGRYVMHAVTRGEETVEEPCEVVACQTGGEYGTWRVLVATRDGYLLEAGVSKLRLVAPPAGDGPYR